MKLHLFTAAARTVHMFGELPTATVFLGGHSKLSPPQNISKVRLGLFV